MGLFAEASASEEVDLPNEIVAEVVEALASLLLDAAGVHQGGADGGEDEPEDHA
jgi:hypothetical protein